MPSRPTLRLQALALLLLGLGACALQTAPPGQGPGPSMAMPPVVRVGVTDTGQISVDREPLLVRAAPAGQGVSITFTLPDQPGLSFIGIVIEGEIVEPVSTEGYRPKPARFETQLRKTDLAVTCPERAQERLRVVCSVNGGKPGQRFLYTVRVARDGRELPPLDPVIRMM
jgi:hypothetical protein